MCFLCKTKFQISTIISDEIFFLPLFKNFSNHNDIQIPPQITPNHIKFNRHRQISVTGSLVMYLLNIWVYRSFLQDWTKIFRALNAGILQFENNYFNWSYLFLKIKIYQMYLQSMIQFELFLSFVLNG